MHTSTDRLLPLDALPVEIFNPRSLLFTLWMLPDRVLPPSFGVIVRAYFPAIGILWPNLLSRDRSFVALLRIFFTVR